MRKSWSIALRSLARNRRRTLAAVLAVSSGFAGLFLLDAYVKRIELVQGVNSVYLLHIGHIAIYKRGGLERVAARPKKFGLTTDEQARAFQVLSQVPEIEMVGRYLVGKGLLGNGCRSMPFFGVGVEPEIERRIMRHPSVLRFRGALDLTDEDMSWASRTSTPGAVALSTGLARRVHKRAAHELPDQQGKVVMPDCDAPDATRQIERDSNVQLLAAAQSGGLSAVDGEVVSVYEPVLSAFSDRALTTSLPHMQELLNAERVTYLAVYLREGESVAELAPQVEKKLNEAGLDVATYAFYDRRINPYFAGILQLFGSMMAFCAALLGAVVFLSVINVMTLSVMERTREIGTFRAIGYRRHHIVMQFLRESWLVALLGSALGVAVSMLLTWSINGANIRYAAPGVAKSAQLAFAPDFSFALILLGCALGLCTIATLLAVWTRTAKRITHLLTYAN